MVFDASLSIDISPNLDRNSLQSQLEDAQKLVKDIDIPVTVTSIAGDGGAAAGTISGIQEQIAQLTEIRNLLTDVGEISEINREIKKLNLQSKELQESGIASGEDAAGGFLQLAGISAAIFGAVSIISDIVGGAINNLLKPAVTLLQSIMKIIAELLRPIVDVIVILLQPILNLLRPILTVVRALLTPFKSIALEFSTIAQQALAPGGAGIGVAIEAAMKAASAILVPFAVIISTEFLKLASGVLISGIELMLRGILTIIQNTFGKISFMGIGDAITNGVELAKQELNTFSSTAITTINNLLTSLETSTLEGLQTMFLNDLETMKKELGISSKEAFTVIPEGLLAEEQKNSTSNAIKEVGNIIPTELIDTVRPAVDLGMKQINFSVENKFGETGSIITTFNKGLDTMETSIEGWVTRVNNQINNLKTPSGQGGSVLGSIVRAAANVGRNIIPRTV